MRNCISSFTEHTLLQDLLCSECQYCLWNSNEDHLYEVASSNTRNNADPHVYSELELKNVDTGTSAVASHKLYANVSQ